MTTRSLRLSSLGTAKMRVKIIAIVMFLVVAVVYFIPLYYIVVNALKNFTEASVLSLRPPTEFRFDNFITAALKGDMILGFVNSVIITVIVVTVIILCASMAAFYIQRSKNRLSKFLYYMFVVGIAAPISIVTTYSLLQSLRLLNTLTGASAIYIVTRISFAIFIYVGFMKTIPTELDQAAIIDGCGNFKLFFQIVLPLMKSITITNIILIVQYVWNQFNIILFFIQDVKKYTLPLSIYQFAGFYGKQWNLIYAGAIISIVPVILLYLFCQKHIISGLTRGAIKG